MVLDGTAFAGRGRVVASAPPLTLTTLCVICASMTGATTAASWCMATLTAQILLPGASFITAGGKYDVAANRADLFANACEEFPRTSGRAGSVSSRSLRHEDRIR
jgi:hypothetical protein